MSINVIQSQPKGYVLFTSSQNWVVPIGVSRIKIIAIGGGGGGGGGYSSTYVGGGGGSGELVYAEMLVTPGTKLNITIGAGGSAGTGGSSPTAGGNGGQSAIQWNGQTIINANAGGGGGAASSSANGSGGSGGSGGALVMQGMIGSIPVFILDVYTLRGNGGMTPYFGTVPALAPGMNSTENGSSMNVSYGYGGAPRFGTYGSGGYGGGVNENGQPGNPGMVLIWWGDE
jgi:hypothetical protein